MVTRQDKKEMGSSRKAPLARGNGSKRGDRPRDAELRKVRQPVASRARILNALWRQRPGATPEQAHGRQRSEDGQDLSRAPAVAVGVAGTRINKPEHFRCFCEATRGTVWCGRGGPPLS